MNIEPHRTCFRALPSKLWRHPRADRDNRPDTRQHGQPDRGGRKNPKDRTPPSQHGTLYAHLRAPASDFHRPAAPPKDLPGALEAPMAARLRGNRRAARSSVLHARGRRGTLPRHRPGRACRTKTPVALSRRAHRDNATVHPSVTRRHCRVVPGGTRPVERQARTKVTRRARLGHARGARGSNRTGFMSEGSSAAGGAMVRTSPPPRLARRSPETAVMSSSRPTGARIVRR